MFGLTNCREAAQKLEEMPPPLPPPRPRVNTESELNRAYTNPESISLKKRKRNIFETVFSRPKSMQKRKSPKPKEQEMKVESPIIDLIRSHRMSYSSPDLSKVDVNQYVNEFESDLMGRSSATEFSIRNEYSILNSTAGNEELEIFDDERNISDNILSTYNISCNDSTVNLVGSHLNEEKATKLKPVAKLIEDPSGYCQMAPIIRTSPVSAPELPPKTPFVFDNTSQRPVPTDLTRTITFCRDYTMEASLKNFEQLSISKEKNHQKSIKNTKNISPPSPFEPPYKHNNSFDEKFPSYYPNDLPKTTPVKDHRKNGGIDYLSKSATVPARKENVYIESPRHSSPKTSKDSAKLAIKSPTKSLLVPSSASQLLTPTMRSSMSERISSASPILYHKYATVTPIKDPASCKKSNDITSSIKRFSSLPRFKKIDFSPLKLKINSVLQRQNPDQM